MRILSVSNFYDTHGGGLERVAAQLSREFARAGHQTAWAASDADGLPENPARLVGLHCINPTEALTGLPMPLPMPGAAMRLSRAVRDSDAVVIHDALYVTSILAMFLAKMRRKPVILIQHISAIPFASLPMRALMRLANAVVTQPMMSAADRLVFISETVRRDLLGVPPRRLSRLVFNGVDQAIFNRGERGLSRLVATRKQWGLPPGAKIAIFVGRFVEKKGLRIIKALAELRPDIHFALAGKGPLMPQDWGMPNVHVIGQQPQEVLAELYRAGDFLLLPSVGEGYPLVVQEAMACGLPVICGTASAGADPEAAQWLSGVEIDLCDPEASATRCAGAIDRLTASPIDTTSMARYAGERYSWSHMASAVIDGPLTGAPESSPSA